MIYDAFVDSVNLASLGFEKVKTKATGRPCYHPGMMLKLYIYGYLNRIQSSRRLKKETHRNVDLMCLLERLTPDFRKKNNTGIKNTCHQFV